MIFTSLNISFLFLVRSEKIISQSVACLPTLFGKPFFIKKLFILMCDLQPFLLCVVCSHIVLKMLFRTWYPRQFFCIVFLNSWPSFHILDLYLICILFLSLQVAKIHLSSCEWIVNCSKNIQQPVLSLTEYSLPGDSQQPVTHSLCWSPQFFNLFQLTQLSLLVKTCPYHYILLLSFTI